MKKNYLHIVNNLFFLEISELIINKRSYHCFPYIVGDLSGITFSQVDFQWGLIATDQNHEVMATNSPITFTVIDSTFNDIDNTMMQIGPDIQDIDFNSLNEILGAK